MIYQAHRGVSSDYPENTMRAFRAAAEEGYGLIECDPRFTRDGKIVLLHDKTLNRTARNRDGGTLTDELRIADVTLEEARAFDYGVWKSPAFAGEPLPTLAELLAFAADARIRIKLDNVWESFPGPIREVLFRVIRESRMAVGVTCRSPEALRLVARQLPQAELHYDGGDLSTDRIQEIVKIADGRSLTVWVCYDNPKTAWFRGTKADETLCQRIAQDAAVGMWILSMQEEAETARRWGAGIIETNGELKPN